MLLRYWNRQLEDICLQYALAFEQVKQVASNNKIMEAIQW